MSQTTVRIPEWRTMHQTRMRKPQSEKGHEPAIAPRPWVAHDASAQLEASQRPRWRMTQPKQRSDDWHTMHQPTIEKPESEKAQVLANATRPWMAHNASTQNGTSHSSRRRMTRRGPEWRTMHQVRMKQATAQEGVEEALIGARVPGGGGLG
jgi:hypothetical protein